MKCGINTVIKGQKAPAGGQTTATVEVQERIGQPTTFHLRHDTDISEGDLPLLVDSQYDPGADFSITVPVKGQDECLVKGPVHAHTIHLEHGGAGTWLEINGSDSSIIMDRQTQSAIWADVKDSDAVLSILANYAYTPDVETTSAVHMENKHTLIQRESDLSFIRRLARRNGFQFWVTCDGMGMETAHFKRPVLDGEAKAQLIINLEEANLSSLDVNWDVERPTSMEGKQLDLNTKTDIDVAVDQTPQSILGDQGLSSITGDVRSVHLAAPADDAGNLQARGEGALIEADWFIRATCQTNLEKLGTLVRAHTVVAVAGAGSRYSGNYYVTAVKHTINAVEHLMDIELIRNGWNG